MNGSKKPTKITIKPFRHTVQMEPQYAETIWSLLQNAIHEIHKKNASGLSFEELYRNAYNMVLHKYGDKLYLGLQDVVDTHLQGVAAEVANVPDHNFLLAVNEAWNEHDRSMLMIRDILMYMDRVYVVQHGVLPVYDLGLVLFQSNVARHPVIKERLLKSLLDLIYLERTGELINRSLVKSITQMLVDLGVNSRIVYEEDFEQPFLEATRDFYRVESQEFIASNSCPDYMRKIENRRKEELDRVQHYLDQSSENKVREVVEAELITKHMHTLVHMENSGLVPMLRDDKVEDLSRMYNLFQKVDGGLELMRNVIGDFVKDTGIAIVRDEENMKERGALVQCLLDLKMKYDNLLRLAFKEDKAFRLIINKAFEHFINLNNKAAEKISLFIDFTLRKGMKGNTDEEIDALLDQVMMLFRFIQEKDVFEKFYKNHLAKRLLFGKYVAQDAERNMISKLKAECGYQFTSKLEGMFNDMQFSQDTMERFTEFLAKSKLSLGVDLNVRVLATGNWPTPQVASCNLPDQINRCCDTFKQFYLNSHNGRRLTWQTSMGTADLSATFGSRHHELTVSTYQMCILQLFNKSNVLTFKSIQTATNIPPTDLKRNLLALTFGKYRILLKDSKNKEIEPTDKFAFNKNFKCKLVKIKIAVVDPNVEKGLRVRVDEDRRVQIEAAIVRIMKARKEMEHSNLVAETTAQLSSRFYVQPAAIKKRIECLIEREYLERSKANRKVYNYLA
uniref:Cullin family profile domain-containing protein n=1 Tax=Vannella robusta TaxID=1487602 RepID=A0A7S4HWF0_9EUKA|mmetsp:Transcript_16673/g.21279  ORF Transcript_16673/g.21279 Transcript_16673/m.21279 type:complete len:732 (+) Transcript_16673:66-2261(+)|eukprot:CAMPEP_0206188974 /NCGR_PEP_ID=MMETSP0166-20121206/3906_1 /ASSEMBLY_ACC=CAM_ASM_000260 /TAXON_ID=95228 /ORGANISM="Vannella robusta, Strain DIVA3 518/3/11/1/6" /LENGTH=731 /DNA_ID=CAMNT_0053604829 /DNA_START=36 /DNA_END=2231 /DNA_ORIENTATION=+